MNLLSKRPEWLKPVLFWAAVFVIFAAAFDPRCPGTARAAQEWTADFCSSNALADQGYSLIHGVPSRDNRITWSMPGFVVSNALVCGGSGLGIPVILLGAAQLGCALLLFGIGRLVVSTRCGILASLLFLCSVPALTFSDRWLYVLTVLLVAFLAVWRSLHPSRGRSLLLGSALGISLYILSPLLLFPWMLVVFEGVHALRKGSFRLRPWLVDVAALCLVPIVMLLPWVWLNWQLNHKFVLLEDGRAGLHLVTAALGLVHTVPRGDAHSLAGLSKDQSVLWWAIGEVLSHPERYLLAVLQRVKFVISLNPWLGLLGTAGVGLGLYRKWKGAAAFTVLVVYWLVLHSLMSTEQRYFIPFWPLLLVPAVGLLDYRKKDTASGASEASGRLVYGLLGFTAVPLLALMVFVYGLLLTYPSRASDPHAMERELARSPDSVWLLKERGMQLLKLGKVPEAAAHLSQAVALRGNAKEDADLKLKAAWALAAQGAPLDQLQDLLPTSGYGLLTERYLLEAFAHLQQGNLTRSEERFQTARQRHEGEVLDVPFLQDAKSGEHLVRADQGLRQLALDVFRFWSPPQQATLLEGLGRLARTLPDFYLDCQWQNCAGVAAVGRAMEAELPEDAYRIFLAMEWTGTCVCAENPLYQTTGVEELVVWYEKRSQHQQALRLRAWLAGSDPQKRRSQERQKRIP